MVIGFDASRAFGKARTGTENYSYNLLKALSKIDQTNSYVIYTRSTADSMGFPPNFIFKTIKWPKFWTQAGLAIRTFTDKIDILFVPAHTLPLIRRPFLKTVLTVHDLGSEYLPSMHQLKQRLYLGFMQKVQLKTADRIIAVSGATKEDLIKKIGIKGGKITVVHEGYDQELLHPLKNDIVINVLNHYDLKPRSYYFFIGTVQPRKNLERILKAFSIHLERGYAQRGGVKLVIAGQRGWMSSEIYNLPKKLGISKKVKFLGFAPQKDLPALYCGAIALLYPSLFEGFGFPVLEAQACGCPVLTSNLSSMPEVAGKGALLVDPYNIDDIVKGMKAILSKDRRDKLVASGRENIKRFSWQKCARETLQVLTSV